MECVNYKRTIGIVYFSGTGGTERAALELKKAINNRGIEAAIYSLERENIDDLNHYIANISKMELIIILYPVHAFDAPEPIYQFICRLPEGNGIRTAVISVSGGGEVFPNKACRTDCIKALSSKGYAVSYERMLIMPSNIFVETMDHLAMHLLKALPVKAEHCIKELLEGTIRRTRPQLSSRVMTALFKLEKPVARLFGSKLTVTEACTSCEWCEKSCPRENIHMKAGKPNFGRECIACLRCIYGCPKSAIKPKVFGILTVKEGYDLSKLEERMKGIELEPAEKLAKGVFAGLLDYLQHEEV